MLLFFRPFVVQLRQFTISRSRLVHYRAENRYDFNKFSVAVSLSASRVHFCDWACGWHIGYKLMNGNVVLRGRWARKINVNIINHARVAEPKKNPFSLQLDIMQICGGQQCQPSPVVSLLQVICIVKKSARARQHVSASCLDSL